MYTNFRWSKSLDNASDASPDKNALTTGSVGGGQYSFGATAASDRSVSTYNIPYAWNLVAVYDLPFGRDSMFGANAWKPLQFAFGDWNISGVERLTTGYPFTPTIATDNLHRHHPHARDSSEHRARRAAGESRLDAELPHRQSLRAVRELLGVRAAARRPAGQRASHHRGITGPAGPDAGSLGAEELQDG